MSGKTAIAMSRTRAIFEILLCAALWSIAGIFMKLIPWSGFVIAGLRSAVAGAVMGVYMLARRQRLTFSMRSVLGGAMLAVVLTCFSVANKLTTAANAIVLQFTSPIWLMLLSALFLHKRFTRADIAAAVLTFFGIALFFADGLAAGRTAGNCVALLAGLAFGCYYICLGEGGDAERSSSVVIGNALTFLVGVPFLFTTQPVFTAQSVGLILLLGVVQLGIPYVLLARASGYCPPLVCSLLGALEPLLNPVWVAIFDGETPGPLALAGAAVVIATITVWCVRGGKRKEVGA